jgi:hypothetical protein
MTIARVYSRNQQWERLRVLGWSTFKKDRVARADITFTPLRQFRPAYDHEDPEMSDLFMSQLYMHRNTVSDLGLLPNPWYICNLQQVDAAALGSQLKYLLRCSNTSYPGLLADAQGASDLYYNEFTDEGKMKVSWAEPKDSIDLLEVQAYDEQMVIRGGSVGTPEYWFDGYPTRKRISRYGKHSVWDVEDIPLPTNVSDRRLGMLIQRACLAFERFPYPPPPELEGFWQQLQEIPAT